MINYLGTVRKYGSPPAGEIEQIYKTKLKFPSIANITELSYPRKLKFN